MVGDAKWKFPSGNRLSIEEKVSICGTKYTYIGLGLSFFMSCFQGGTKRISKNDTEKQNPAILALGAPSPKKEALVS